MNKEEVNIVENLIQAISILNKNDEYLESLADKLSECDKLETDYRHIIEFTPADQVNLKQLYISMQNNFNKRRKIKIDMAIGRELNTNINKLTSKENRQFLIQVVKNALSRNESLEYNNRVLNDSELSNLIIREEKKKRGRPKKMEIGA